MEGRSGYQEAATLPLKGKAYLVGQPGGCDGRWMHLERVEGRVECEARLQRAKSDVTLRVRLRLGAWALRKVRWEVVGVLEESKRTAWF